MTAMKSFKRLVRARMEKTGESYTAARAQLLAAPEPKPVLATSDDAIRERTGHGWEEWFDRLDAFGAADRPRREVSRWLAGELGLDPLAWNVQAIVGSYERARGLRAVGEMPDGFRATVSRTVAVPIEQLFAAFLDDAPAELRTRKTTAPKSAHFDWGDGPGRVHAIFDASDAGKSRISLEHARLADAGAADVAKALWRERLDALKARLEA